MDGFQIATILAAGALLTGIFLVGDGDVRVSYAVGLLFGSIVLGYTALVYEALTWSDENPQWRIEGLLIDLLFRRTNKILIGDILFWMLVLGLLAFEILTGRASESISSLFSGFSLKYEPLSTSRAEIRLLTILATADQTSVVCCNLQHVSLVTNAGAYKTLSYCWGDPNVTRVIYVNGRAVRITVNLEGALRRLRADGHHRIWVDALCINQNDLEERSLQVRDMKAIYSWATEVIVWVGEEEENSSEVLDFMEATRESSVEDFIAAYDDLHVEDIYRVSEVASRYSFDSFFKRPFWRRVWIIQEIAVASTLRLYCGHRHVEWANFSSHMRLVRQYHQQKETGLVPTAAESLLRFRSTFKDSQPLSLMTALFDSRRFLATDARDKVYALVGLTYDGASLIPILNYHQSVESIFFDLAKSIITKSGSLDIITLQNSDGRKRHHLPSWVPDWSNLQDSPRPWQRNLFSSDSIRETHGQRSHGLMMSGMQHQHLGVGHWNSSIEWKDGGLNVKGRFLDSVDGLSGCARSVIQQPKSTASPYGGDADHAIWNSLAFFKNLHTKGESDPSSKPLGHQYKYKFEDFPIFNNWIKQNQSFSIGANFLGRLYRKKVRDLIVPGWNDWREYFSNVNDVLRNEMRLFSSSQGFIGMTHAQTRLGDGIFEIDGCGMLIVLRKCKGGFQVIGEACLHDFRTDEVQGFERSITLL